MTAIALWQLYNRTQDIQIYRFITKGFLGDTVLGKFTCSGI